MIILGCFKTRNLWNFISLNTPTSNTTAVNVIENGIPCINVIVSEWTTQTTINFDTCWPVFRYTLRYRLLRFILYLMANPKYNPPPPILYSEGLIGGFFSFWRLIFGGAYFQNFTVSHWGNTTSSYLATLSHVPQEDLLCPTNRRGSMVVDKFIEWIKFYDPQEILSSTIT